jgi:hypothetical protein
MGRKTRKIFILVIVGGGMLSLLVLLGIEIFNAFKETDAALSEISVINSLTKQDSSLLSDDAIKSITRIDAYHYRNKESVTVVSIEKDYTLIIHKLNVDKSFSLKNDIRVNNDNKKHSTGHVYSVVQNAWPVEIHYLSEAAKPSSLIYLSIEDQAFHTDIQLDSLVGFSFKLKSSSIMYSQESPVEFVVRKKEGIFRDEQSMPTSVLFWRNKLGVYVFYLIQASKSENSSPLTLQEMIRNDGSSPASVTL